jgi:hypothetical protein
MDEAYILLTQAQVDNASFRAHFDLYSFSQAWEQMTGRTFPIVVQPTPAPPPAASFPGATDLVSAHIIHAATRARLSVTEWLNRHFTHYFNI